MIFDSEERLFTQSQHSDNEREDPYIQEDEESQDFYIGSGTNSIIKKINPIPYKVMSSFSSELISKNSEGIQVIDDFS